MLTETIEVIVNGEVSRTIRLSTKQWHRCGLIDYIDMDSTSSRLSYNALMALSFDMDNRADDALELTMLGSTINWKSDLTEQLRRADFLNLKINKL